LDIVSPKWEKYWLTPKAYGNSKFISSQMTANAKLIKLEKKKMKRNKQTHAITSKHNIRTLRH